MKHKITIDKENKVLKLQVSIPKKKFKRDPNVRFYDQEAWELIKNTKVEGYTLQFKASMTQLDNYGLFRHEGEFIFPLKEMPKKTSEKLRARLEMQKTRNHISFSEIKIWQECPHKHKLYYLDNMRMFKGNEYTAFGKALHAVSENFLVK